MRWFVLQEDTRDVAIHAALVHTGHAGQVIYFGGDQHDPVANTSGDIRHTRIFDCQTLDVLDPPPGSPAFDSFCCGQTILADGRLLIAGGTDRFPQDAQGIHEHVHFTGLMSAALFDPELQLWDMVPDMAHGRWYPTLITLPNGHAFVFDGHTNAGVQDHHENNVPDIYLTPSNAWAPRQAYADPDNVILYPRGHVAPNLQVFVVTPQSTPDQSEWYDWIADTWTVVPSAVVPSEYRGFNTSSVLLPLRPPDYRASVLLVNDVTPHVIDLEAAAPSYQPRPRTGAWPGNPPVRQHASPVILPTGQVFMSGGLQNDTDDTTHVFEPELYFPDTGTWQRLPAPASVPRGYHSVALLMPDGRVWTAGGSIDKAYAFHSPIFDSSGNIVGYNTIPDHRQLHIEIFEPDYFGQTRPRITVAPTAIRAGEDFVVHSPDEGSVAQAALIRAGSMTHAFNGDQRYIQLRIVGRTAGQLTLEAPPTSALAPPGWYLLFLLDESGVPSVGEFVRMENTCLIEEVGTHVAHRRRTPGEVIRQLAQLREFRATLRTTEPGRRAEALLQQRGEEVLKLLRADPDLLESAGGLIAVAAKVLSTGAVVTGELLEVVERFMDRIAEGGVSEQLGATIEQLRASLPALLGKAPPQAIEELPRILAPRQRSNDG